MVSVRRILPLVTLLATTWPVAGQAEQWLYYGGDAGGQKYSPLNQINAANVGQLEVAWQYSTGELARRPELQSKWAKVQVNPILLPAAAGGHLMICTPFGRVIALDPATGTERWVHEPDTRVGGYGTPADPEGRKSPGFTNCRGVAYWAERSETPPAICSQRVFVATHDLRLIALDAPSGKPCPGFGEGGTVALEAGVLAAHPPAAIGEVKFSGPPLVINDVVVLGTSVRDFHRANAPNGAVRAFDARSGAPRWRFDPIPRSAADPAYAGWSEAAARDTGAGNVWGLMSADAERDLVFMPTSSPSPDFYGGTRPGDNRYASSIVALRGTTGEVAWHFQTVHHDVWDYDNAAQPTLVDLSKDGKPFPAVIQATKTGMLYIFNRDTGEPFFPIEERPVPQGGVPGEALSPTQPFPVKPPPLVPHEFRAEDFWGMTPWERNACVKAYGNKRYGKIFTPPSLEGTIVVPSTAGGVNWGGVTVDPDSKVLVTNVLRLAHYAQLLPATDDNEVHKSMQENMMGAPAQMLGTPYAIKQSALLSPLNQMPCTAPPYAELVAVDLQQGEILWRGTLGVWDHTLPPPMAAPYSLPLPLKWGTPTFGGPMLTAGGLVFIGATGDDRLRAFDIRNGRELWSATLPTGAFAVPMSYEIGGRQFVVVASGGHAFVYQKAGDQITAFALPAARLQ
ncbi:MAG: pyrroloquinoline quinone-dependent dehydrogenase [Gammaproteobacteria bacterium]|nr:pyrroloquinoline quinone-dependent dehydrogenase [Gammaproteobacteria bacterium]